MQIPWVWPRGILPKTQKRSNAPRAGHAFATNPLLSPWVALGLPGGRPLGMAADTRIKHLFTQALIDYYFRNFDDRYLFIGEHAFIFTMILEIILIICYRYIFHLSFRCRFTIRCCFRRFLSSAVN